MTAGDQLGNHATSETMSDVTVFNNGVYSSAFAYMTNDVLNELGFTWDEAKQMIISEATRNQYSSYCKNPYDPLPAYQGAGTPPADWCGITNGQFKCELN